MAGPVGRMTERMTGAVGTAVEGLKVLRGAGLIEPVRPDHLVGMGLGVARWGYTPAAGYAAGAARYRKETAVVDERGATTFGEIDRRTNAIARGLAEMGINEGASVGVLARNSRYFIEAVTALAKVGADALLLNTGFAAPQLADVLADHGATAIVHDEEFTDLVGEASRGRTNVLAWHDEDVADDATSLDELAEGDDHEPRPPVNRGRQVILTSGTTGKPKGAPRQVSGVEPAISFLSGIPLKARDTTLIAAPLFHAWGFAHLGLGTLLSSTFVLGRKAKPEWMLQAIEENQVRVLVAVPVMLQRILELPEETLDKYDTSSLEVVAVSGSALSGELSTRFMDRFGDVIYNLYGSTEVAYAAIASPADLRKSPGTSGRPPFGTTLRIYDDDGNELPPGETGRIFVGNEALFGGYSGGGSKEMIDGLMATGDIGHLDDDGRLMVEGRDDDMIVSGGENVYPGEVEEVLLKHPDIDEAAVVGVPDEDFGERLAAFVVAKNGNLDESTVKEHVKSQLAGYKVPRDVTFIDDLPRNETGKVVKKELVPDSDDSE